MFKCDRREFGSIIAILDMEVILFGSDVFFLFGWFSGVRYQNQTSIGSTATAACVSVQRKGSSCLSPHSTLVRVQSLSLKVALKICAFRYFNVYF